MLSPDIQDLFNEAQDEETTYRPSPEVLKQLDKKDFIMIVGPTAMGKSTLMNAAVELDDQFARVSGFTTRPKRANDEPGLYDYIPHTDEGIKSILAEKQAGNLVQYAIFPTTGYMYGTQLKDYPEKYNLKDTLSNVAGSLAELPFHNTHIIGIVTTPEAWQTWLLQRFKPDDPDFFKRIDEAIQSLEWLLSQPKEKIKWVYNRLDDVTTSAKELIGLVKDEMKPINYSSYAQSLLELAKSLQK
jgi:guanylate kinase